MKLRSTEGFLTKNKLLCFIIPAPRSALVTITFDSLNCFRFFSFSFIMNIFITLYNKLILLVLAGSFDFLP